MDRFALDLRAALRSLMRSPGTAFIAVAALAMGIGFTTTMFSIVRGGTRSLPFVEPHELVIVTATFPRNGIDDMEIRAFDFLEWSRQQTAFEGLGAFRMLSTNLSGDGERAQRYDATGITPNTLALLGEQPLLGRGLQPGDAQAGAEPVVVLGYDLWTTRFAADPGILGRIIRTDGEQRTVVGVMPPRFGFPISSDLWLPYLPDASAAPREGDYMRAFGRLRDGITVDRANAEMATIAARLAAAQPETHDGWSARVYPFIDMETPREIRYALYLMVGAVSFVLLIACANVANLLLARAAMRTQEVAIRTALGAGRSRIIGLQLLESTMLAAIGVVLGLAFTAAALRFFALASASILEAFWVDFRIDGVVLAFASTLTVIAAAVAGVMPAARLSRIPAAAVLKEGAGGASGLRMGRLSRVLVVTQVALACGLLVLSATFVKSAVSLRATTFTFPVRDVLTAQVVPSTTLQQDAQRWRRLIRELTLRTASIPGIRSAALTSALPGRGGGNWSFTMDGAATDPSQARSYTAVSFVTPGFLDVLESRVIRGRDLEWRDDETAPAVALVNESWVARWSPDREPLGRIIEVAARRMEIVGVLPDLFPRDIEEEVQDGVYAPFLQREGPVNVRLMARGPAQPLALIQPVRDAVVSIDPDLPVEEFATLYDAIFSEKRVLDAFSMLFFLFGLGALFLTVIGTYGVVAFSVSRRTREIGVRVALGARSADIARLVLGEGGRQLAVGGAIGMALAWALSRALATAIEPLQQAGVFMFGAVLALLIVTGVLALLIPARRALRVEPVRALRSE